MKLSSVSAFALLTFASAAWCEPPLAMDDASTLMPCMCQLEAEQRQSRKFDATVLQADIGVVSDREADPDAAATGKLGGSLPSARRRRDGRWLSFGIRFETGDSIL